MDEAATPKERSMTMGHQLLQQGKPEKARKHFLYFAELDPPTAETIRGLKMAGVASRNLGEFTEAIEYLEKASLLTEQSSDYRLRASILRDLGAAYQDIGLRDKSILTLLNALLSYERSITASEDGLEQFDISGLERDFLEVERACTLSFKGMLQFEMGSYEAGRKNALEAYESLSFFANTYDEGHRKELQPLELNALIRVLRVSSFWERRLHIDRAYELTSTSSESPGSRPRVKAAMLGNTAYKKLAAKAR